MSRVRVLISAASLGILGGQAVQARSLVDHLRQSPALEVGFIAINPTLPAPLAWLQRIKFVRTVVNTLAYVVNLLRTVPRYDVVHAFSASYSAFLISTLPALLVARLYGRKALLNYHSGEAGDHLARWPISRWLIRKLPHVCIVPSAYLVDEFARFGMAATAIYNFVPIERLPWRERSTFRPVILSNRNLEPMYNVGAVLRAFAKVQAAHPSASLVVAGDGSQRTALEALSRELSLRNVEFIGRVPNEQIGALYGRCDLFVNASLIDNMPLSLIEAFACGLPIVTSDAGGIPYMVKHEQTALVVPGSAPDGLAAGLLRLLDEPALARQLAAEGRAECEQHYVWPKVRPQWEQCYQRLAAGAAP